MKPIVRFSRMDRRALLSSLAMLPLLSGLRRLTSAAAQAQGDALEAHLRLRMTWMIDKLDNDARKGNIQDVEPI